ncbi:MAG: hypothetical protein LBH45_04845 [Campylobacteraceae bacterium]|jgi:hypothetical protein|nr:hypothetical protein [Campylobacteraceae bacterium]
MKRYSFYTGILVAMLFLDGCTSNHMQSVNLSESDMKLAQNESAIIFLRPTILGGAIQAPIAEFVDNNLKFVAIISAKTKVFYKTTSGKHFFVVGGESSNLLEADFEGGKTYYSYIEPYMGFAKARFEFEPVKNGARLSSENDKKDPFATLGTTNNSLWGYERAYFDSKEFKNDLEDCMWYESKPVTYEWFAKNKNSMWKKYESALKRHQNIKPEKRKIIKPEYGH